MTEQKPGPLLRWGIAGTGAISRQIAADFTLVAGAALEAVSSRSAITAADFADQFDIPHRYDDYAAMLDSDIDAVYIGTPHTTHFRLAKEALRRGRHVLCEKPLGLNATEVRELTAIAQDSGAFLMEAMWMKFNPLYTRLRELIDAGAIGDVRSVRAGFGAPFPPDASSRWKPGGSALLDLGIYPVTLSHLVLGQPASITATGTIRSDDVDLSEQFTLAYPAGRFFHGASSMVEFLDTSAAIAGTDGWIGIEPGFWFAETLTIHGYGPTGPTLETVTVAREGHGYVPMLRHVGAAILAGQQEHPFHSWAATAQVFDTLDEIRRQLTGTRESETL